MFSTPEQLDQISKIVTQYLRLPMSDDTVPGIFFENVLAYVRSGKKLDTYDFVDVIDDTAKIGWQVKSTKEKTPLTWNRAKLPNVNELIECSRTTASGLQTLGNMIIDHCNRHASESIKLYNLEEIYYARLIIFEDKIRYFEKKLCDKSNQQVFNPELYKWEWASPRRSSKKETLSALHGFDLMTGNKVWAWHGQGENQLHFCGEQKWWDIDAPGITFPIPTNKITMSALLSI